MLCLQFVFLLLSIHFHRKNKAKGIYIHLWNFLIKNLHVCVCVFVVEMWIWAINALWSFQDVPYSILRSVLFVYKKDNRKTKKRVIHIHYIKKNNKKKITQPLLFQYFVFCFLFSHFWPTVVNNTRFSSHRDITSILQYNPVESFNSYEWLAKRPFYMYLILLTWQFISTTDDWLQKWEVYLG